jgi:hypothetical protein
LFHLVFGSHIGRALGADSGEKSGLASDIDTATVESLNALDPKRPIREAVSFFDPKRKSRWLRQDREAANPRVRVDEQN